MPADAVKFGLTRHEQYLREAISYSPQNSPQSYYILDSLLEDIDKNLEHPISRDRCWHAYSCNF